MDIKQFQATTDLKVKEIKDKHSEQPTSSLRPLALLLTEWYEQKFGTEEADNGSNTRD